MTNIFLNFFNYDTLLHTISGFVFAWLGLKLITKLNNKKKVKKLFTSLFIVSFSMYMAVIWEFFEFSNDFFRLSDMQKDRIIYNFSSKELNREKPNEIRDIDHTILYDKDNNIIVRTDGYLDIGLIDTIKDMFVNYIGAIIFAFIVYYKKEKMKE